MKNSNETSYAWFKLDIVDLLMTTIHKDFGRIRTKFEVIPLFKISQRMHSLNRTFVLSRASCLSYLKANPSTYSLGSIFSPFLPALLQELFLFVSAFILSLSLVWSLYFSPLKIHSVPLTLYNSASLKLFSLLFSPQMFSKEYYASISSTSYLSLLICNFAAFPFQGLQCDILVGNR